jgi:RNA-binding protein
VPTLTSRQRIHLRGLGHHLDAIVQVGKEGITDALCRAIDEALDQHELLKIRLGENAPGDRHELAAAIAERCAAALIQTMGRTVLIYRRRPDSDPRPHIPLMPSNETPG